MTKFTKENFHYHGGYRTYGYVGMRGDTYVREDEFVARFKYNAGDRGRFVTFLIKNFTVEEYFAAREAGYSPLDILESRGFVSTTLRKQMKRAGWTTFTMADYREHFEQYMKGIYGEAKDCSEFWAKKDAEYAEIRNVMEAA